MPCSVEAFTITVGDLNFFYNQATTKLAFHSNETSNDKLSNIYNWLYYCHPGARKPTQKLVHFYMLITLKHKKVVEKFVKTCFMVKNTHLLHGHMLLAHIGIASMGIASIIQMCNNNIILKLMETYKYTLNKYHVHWLSSFKHLKLCKLVLKYLSLYGKLFIFT